MLDLATRRLRGAGVPSARLDARVLLGHAMRVNPASLLPGSTRVVEASQAAEYAGLIDRRLLRTPVSHLTGSREFYGRPFHVTPDVLDPRADSECVVEMALACLPADRASRILDLGTGTGCLLLTLLAERVLASGTGIDVSDAALAVARGNATALGLADRAAFQVGNWLDGITGQFDLVISNPPYIPAAEIPLLQPEVRDHEPRLALVGGDDGLDPYRHICPELGARLAPDGVAVFEFGMGQARQVAAIAQASGLVSVQTVRDLGGIERGITLKSAVPA